MKTKYYYLPLDSFGQPSGIINELYLTKQEYNAIKRDVFSPYYYVYTNYEAAYYRSIN